MCKCPSKRARREEDLNFMPRRMAAPAINEACGSQRGLKGPLSLVETSEGASIYDVHLILGFLSPTISVFNISIHQTLAIKYHHLQTGHFKVQNTFVCRVSFDRLLKVNLPLQLVTNEYFIKVLL